MTQRRWNENRPTKHRQVLQFQVLRFPGVCEKLPRKAISPGGCHTSAAPLLSDNLVSLTESTAMSSKKPSQKAAKRPRTTSRRSTGSREPAIRTLMLPRDTNPLGSIFGGHILSLLDLAATQHARTVSPRKYVTKVIREVDFIAPVFVGDVVSFYAETVKLGNSSIAIRVDVESTRGVDSRDCRSVTSAEVVMVAVDDRGQSIPIFDKVSPQLKRKK